MNAVVDAYSKKADENFHALKTALADVLMDQEMAKPHHLLPKKTMKERFEKQVDIELQSYRKKLDHGASLILESLIHMADKNPEFFSDDVADDLSRIISLSQLLKNNKDQFAEDIKEEKSLQEIAKVSDETIEKMYQAAKKIYEEKQFSDACDAFGFLTLLNDKKYIFWLALANSHFFLKNYESALIAYAIASEINSADIFPHLHSSICYEEIQEFDNAIGELDVALYIISATEQHTDLKEQIEAKKAELTKNWNKPA